VLDATVDPLGEGTPWEAIHRARPRAPLTCRECGHGLHAKLSPKGLRFFAHDRAAPTCSLVGETMAHRLLKLQLASAIRDAGWYAELEVAGEGWRADVLATSPDGTRRMAWEAQLAQITVDELRERTHEDGGLRGAGVLGHRS
jgi:competence protein CoiA